MKKALVAAAAAAAVLALVAAGCGGDGGGGGALTAEEYAAQLDEICADFNAKQEEIGEPESIEELGTKGQEILDEFRRAVDDARDLTPPDEIADQVDRFLELADEQIDLIDQLIEAAADGDTAKIQELGNQIDPLDTESDELATELGAPACAED